MTVRLLFDESIPWTIVERLSASFPFSEHVRGRSGGMVTDREAWRLSRAGSFVFVTADPQFIDMSAVRGAPPKVIWLKGATTDVEAIAARLEALVANIEQFVGGAEHTCFAMTAT